MDAELEVREIAVEAFSGAEKTARGSQLGSLAAVLVEPAGVELARFGRRFWLGNHAAVTGIAPVQALPTTAAQWGIFNNEPAGGKTYYFEELGMFLTSGTPGVGGIMLACLYTLPVIVGDGTAGAGVGSMSVPTKGGTTAGNASRAIVKSAQTITAPSAPIWYPIAQNSSPNVTAFAGSTFFEHRDIQGRIALPPQCGLGLAVVAPAGTSPLYAPFAQWVELETTNR